MRRHAQLAVLVSPLLLTACAGGVASGDEVRVDGSSTVLPLTATAAEDFQVVRPDVRVTVGASGTGGGFEKFCRGETDANDASRPITPDEAEQCRAAGIEFGELQVAVDALTLVVNPANDWVECLTMDQLRRIWAPGSEVTNWNQVDPTYPDEPLKLFGPGTDSGTFDYFTAAVNGIEGASRTDFTASEDDNVIVQGVEGSTGGLGYLGYTYYEENQERLHAVAVDNGRGCVAPSTESAQDGSYSPLSRPLFVYASRQALQRPEVRAFFDHYVAHDEEIARGALYIPLSAGQRSRLEADYARLTSPGGSPS